MATQRFYRALVGGLIVSLVVITPLTLNAQDPLTGGPGYNGVSPYAGGTITGGTLSSGVCAGAIADAWCYDVYGPQARALPTDAVPKNGRLYAGQSASPSATVNTGGANLFVHGGLGVRRAAMNFATCVNGDTITVTTVNSVGADLANVGTAGVNFACGASNAAFATNVAAWADTITGVDSCANAAGCTGFTGVDGTAYFWRAAVDGMPKIGLATSRAANAALTQGANGTIYMWGNLNSPDGGSTLYNFASWMTNGTQQMTLQSAGGGVSLFPITNYVTAGASSFMGANGADLTVGTMTATNTGEYRCAAHRYDWTNAMVVALGAAGTGNIAVATLPARTTVQNAYVRIATPDTSANALTVSLGRTGAAYIDYIVASDAKAAANTIYGDGAAERGANLTGYDLPSYTGTTVVNAQFIKTATNLNTVTGSTGTVYFETCLLP